MGYRSEVLIRIKHHDPIKHQELMVDLLLLQPVWVNDIKNGEKFDKFIWNDKQILLYAESWKWYESIPIVQACNEMWQHFEDIADDDQNLYGVYLRVGEEMGDDESNTFGDDAYTLGELYRSIDYEE